LLTGKINGAVGNYNSHYFSYPNVNWRASCEEFVENKLNLKFNPYTTQIESHDSLIKYLGEVGLYNAITIGLCKDTWEYISKGYLTQKIK
jgi:adenylosuccinate lyase